MLKPQVNNGEDKVCTTVFHQKTPSTGWKCPKRLKLRLGPPRENNDSKEDSEIEKDELLLMALQCYEEQDSTQNGIVDNHNAHCVSKETKTNVLKTSILECEKDRDHEQVVTMEIDELLLMVL